MTARVLVLGCGYAGRAVAERARERGDEVLTSVRSPERANTLRDAGFSVIQQARLDASIAALVTRDTHVVIGFPPDGVTDALIAPALSAARAVTYISSTGVYGERRGQVDDLTPLPTQASERGARILSAEACYRAVGATVLRCPGIYGPDRGLHMRILRGEHRVPGAGNHTLSRIHIADLASFVLASVATRGETFVVGDLAPAPHIEVVRFVCEAYGVPVPESVPLESVHESLRADRQIDASRALATLAITLRYPTFREGMAPAATGIARRA